MCSQGSVNCRRTYAYRGLSTAIAGLIVLTFLLIAVVPLLLNLYSGAIHSHLTLSTELTSKLRIASQKLNITYDIASSSPPSFRVYTAINNGPDDVLIKFYVVTDGSNVYLVDASSTYNKYLSIGTLKVFTDPISDASIEGDNVVLKSPRGMVLIKVFNGRLLGAILGLGIYVHVNAPRVTVETTYAEVASSIKTNYINLSSFTSLSDLFTDPDIVIVNDPRQNVSNTTLLNLGAFISTCFKGTDPDNPSGGVNGGFQPVVDSAKASAIYMHNLGVWPGSMILGGRSTEYSSPAIKFSLYMAGYDLIAYNTSEPGFIVVNTEDYGYAFCYSFVFDDGYAVSDCIPEGSINWGSSSLVSRALYSMMANTPHLDSLGVNGSLEDTFNIVYSDRLGLILWNSYLVAYCPPGSFSKNTSTGQYIFDVKSTCFFAEKDSAGYDIVEGEIGPGSSIVASSVHEIFGDNEAGIKGQGIGNISYIINYRGYASEIGADKDYPMVVKLTYLTGDRELLSIYDNVLGRLRKSVEAFGVYLYSGEYFNTISGRYYVYYYVSDLYGENGEISVFSFQQDTTSGLRPFMLLADTDGNGLTELIIMDEWFSPDYYSGGQTDLADLVGASNGYQYHPAIGLTDSYYGYGCIEKSIGYFYLKFIGDYAVNGSQIAEVSVQVRYSFHDNLAGDLDEVDEPKEGIWGFAVINSQGNETASSLYIYQQLQNYEDTWPISMAFHTDAVYLPIPDKPELYYIVFKFGDPYDYAETWYSLIHDDIDMTVRIEWLGMWYLHR